MWDQIISKEAESSMTEEAELMCNDKGLSGLATRSFGFRGSEEIKSGIE